MPVNCDAAFSYYSQFFYLYGIGNIIRESRQWEITNFQHGKGK